MLCLDLKMEPKELEGIGIRASGSDPGRRRGLLGTEPETVLPFAPHLATLQEPAGPGAAWLTHLPRAACQQRLRGEGHPVPVFNMSAIKGTSRDLCEFLFFTVP